MKRTLLLVLLVALSASAALAQANFNLARHVIGGGGGHSAGGSYTVDSTAAQPMAGFLQGGSFTVTGGFWAGGPAQPIAVADLRASRAGSSLRLDWTAVTKDVEGNNISGVTYNVYRAVDLPYFSVGVPYVSGIASATYTDPDPNVVGNVEHSYYYLVKAVYNGLTSSDSHRVGCFSFGLAPGSP